MVDLVEIQAAYYMVAATGVLIAAVFYILNLRISQKNQELSLKTQELTLKTQQQNLETRQAQLFMQIFMFNQSKELADPWFKLYSSDLTDAKKIVQKIFVEGDETFGEIARSIATVGTHYDGIGLYVRKGLIDFDMVKELLSGDIIMSWEKLGPLIMEIRKVTSFTVTNYEWLYNKLKDTQV